MIEKWKEIIIDFNLCDVNKYRILCNDQTTKSRMILFRLNHNKYINKLGQCIDGDDDNDLLIKFDDNNKYHAFDYNYCIPLESINDIFTTLFKRRW